MATALLSFGLLTMIGVFASGLRLIAQGRDLEAATDIARSFLEATQELAFDELPAGPQTFDGRVPDAEAGVFPPAPYPSTTLNNQQFELVVTIAKQDDYLKLVTVEVRWSESSQVRLQTLVAP